MTRREERSGEWRRENEGAGKMKGKSEIKRRESGEKAKRDRRETEEKAKEAIRKEDARKLRIKKK
jgi:hypothetical protein